MDPSNDVAVGDTVTHTLTATNTGRVALSGATATVDVSDLLDDATIDDLPDGVELDGSTLTWSVPTTATSGVSTVSFTSTVRPSSSGGGIVVTARPNGLGAGCGTCGSTIATEVQDDDWVAGISADPAPGAVAPG
ncbi:DUF11 domain-containing protein, partial [Xanthomonas euvesicatoria]|uniref:DUF11 domain-containing protein n=1 Tax=Xanthomonas euvesicatoria TaxID=456327 RepID=UPI0019D1C34D